MLTADPSDRKNTFKVAFLTGASIFVMGYLNALALNTYELGTMVTPQTGNVIWMGIFAASGYWEYFLQTLGLFLGFIGGAVFALFTQHLFRGRPTQFFWNWSFFALPIAAYPIFLQYVAPPAVSFAVLGFSAGAALGFFRKMYHLEINTSMATGNVRFLGLHFAQAFLKKKPAGAKKDCLEAKSFWLFFVAVFAFAFGAFSYVMLAKLDASLATGLNLTIGDGEAFRTALEGRGGSNRLTMGLRGREYGSEYIQGALPRNSTNVARIAGLLFACAAPYFFCPKARKPGEAADAK